MITFDLYSKHNFLGPSWYKHFKEVGLDMGIDASYYLVKDDKVYRIYDKGEFKKKFGKDFKNFSEDTVIPTYTIADMLYKIDEWPCDNSNDKSWGGIAFFKDAPFYGFYYPGLIDDCYSEYPIEGAAMLLLRCAKEGIHYVKDISDK